MLIANPIYDIVFKYMMENLEIARVIISTIINEEIDHLDFKTVENIHRVQEQIAFYHLDFAARIRNKDGSYKEVLIELRKTNAPLDLLRFRRCLKERFRSDDVVIDTGGSSKTTILPIITIYFLGFALSPTLPAVIKVNHENIDVLTGEKVEEKDDFIECLTHDAYVIQIKSLHLEMNNKLEVILSIFNQENFVGEGHHLKNYAYPVEDDELIKKILRKLEEAAADNELLRKMELEKMAYREYEIAFDKLERRLYEIEKALDETKKALEEKDKARGESKKVIDEKEKTIEESKKALDEKDQTIQELLQKLAEKK